MSEHYSGSMEKPHFHILMNNLLLFSIYFDLSHINYHIHNVINNNIIHIKL
jgi:hypothetical protein